MHFLQAFYTPPHKKWRGIMLYPPNRLSVRPSSHLSVSTSFPDSNLRSFWPIFFKLCMEIGNVNGLNLFINNRVMALDWYKICVFPQYLQNKWMNFDKILCIDIYKIHVGSNVHYFRLIFNRVMALDLCKKCVFPQYLQNQWMNFDKIVHMLWYIQDTCCF